MGQQITDAEVEACIREALPARVTLVWVDRDDSFEHRAEEFQAVLSGESEFYEVVENDRLQQWEGVCQADSIRQLTEDHIKPALMTLADDYEMLVDEWLDDFRDFIDQLCYERDDSTIVKDLLRNTRSQPAAAILWSNEEGLRSAWELGQSGYTYDGYFKIVVDQLQLDPAKVKAEICRYGGKVAGRWPSRPNRKPYVKLSDFIQELDNTASHCNHLTFVGLFDLAMAEDFSGKVVVPAGNDCGFFDPACGSGSVISMELLRDFPLDTNKIIDTSYDKFELRLDASFRYSINDVYGPTRQFWGSEFK